MIIHHIYSTYTNLPEKWYTLSNANIFFSPQYFKALEEALPSNIKLYYIGLFKKDNLVAIALVQRMEFYLKDTVRRKNKTVVFEHIKGFLSQFIKGNILVIGNLLHTGQHSVFYKESELYKQVFLEAIYAAVKDLRDRLEREEKKKIRLIILKDYFLDEPFFEENPKIEAIKLHKTTVQPNMIMHIRSNWKTVKDYLADMKTKYRTRYKRARKKAASLELKEMQLDDVKQLQNHMYYLYRNVSDKAPFNTFILPKNHFYCIKKELTNNFKVFGYFHKNELVGFYTLIKNNKALETYFLGYNNTYQQQYQLYLNMIYNMACYGIENKFKSIIYARTAMEIKSSIGAKPYDMNIYMKHTSILGNYILKTVFNFIKPKHDWEERNPFKVENT